MSSTSPALTTTAAHADGAHDPTRASSAGRVGEKRSSAPALRRLPVRDVQPPFDDELHGDASSGSAHAGVSAGRSTANAHQGALTLAFALPGGVPAVPELPAPAPRADGDPGPTLRLVPPIQERRRRSADDVLEEEFGPRQTPRALLPDPRPWAGRLVQAVVEAMAGIRPVSQLVRWTTTEVYDSVQNRAIRAMHERRGPAPRRLAEVVRSVHVSEPVDGVAEVCAIVQQGPRCRAIALRLEGADGRWKCTALQLA